MGPLEHAHARLHRLGVILAVIAFAGLLAAALGSGEADGAKVTVIGAGAKARSACTPDNCIVEAKVTGFQTRIGRIKKPFVVRTPGRIVAWSVKLGRPSDRDRRCLTSGCKGFAGFGGPAQARLSVLKRIVNRDRPRPDYKLIRQSPVEVLTPYFGSTVTFTLARPLDVGRGKIIALTIPTWAPVFAAGLGQNNSWRASRKPRKRPRRGCFVKTPEGVVIGADVNAGSPHQRVGKIRRYGCVYRTNRLLYSASLVKRPG